MKVIYKITNLINSKVYIGQTLDFSQRKSQHLFEGREKSLTDRPLYRSMRKHGIDNFEFEIIEECLTDQIADEREIYWIDYFDSTNPVKGYNLSKGGQGHSDESRRKLSAALKDNKHCIGRVLLEETKKKLSEATSKQKCSIGTRSKLRAAHRDGKIPSLRGSSPGESHPSAKLDWEKVRLVRKKFAEGETIQQLVETFGVSRPTISRVVRNVVWQE